MKTFTPYRICPLGAHVDHQYGLVTGFALDQGVTLEYACSDDQEEKARICRNWQERGDSRDVVRLISSNFPGEVAFSVLQYPKKQNDWGDYARAALASLLDAGYQLHTGFSGSIEGTLPIGGLSSSASVIITYIATLCKLNGIHVSGREMVRLALWAENHFVGLRVGKLDQSCEIFSKKDQLLFLDTKTDAIELIPQNPGMPPYQIAIFFSGVVHSLVNSSYNARVDECKTAAYSLKAYAGLPYAHWQDSRLRDVEEEVFLAYENRLPQNFAKRARHYYQEIRRVEKGVQAWRAGDLEAFGRLVFQSGTSSIELYESGSPELQVMHQIALEIPGIYGGRFSGAGFKGCYLAFVDPDKKEQVAAEMEKRYLEKFPAMGGRFSYHFCRVADGAALP